MIGTLLRVGVRLAIFAVVVRLVRESDDLSLRPPLPGRAGSPPRL